MTMMTLHVEVHVLFLCWRLDVCESWEFRCVTVERCVLKLFICNGRDDCGDLSDEDETQCSQFQSTHCTVSAYTVLVNKT